MGSRDEYELGILTGLGWRVALAKKTVIAGGAGFELRWESTGLAVYVWPGLRRVWWLCLKDATRQGGLETLGGAPFPPESELTSLGVGAPGRGRRPSVGGFDEESAAMLDWTLPSLAEVWVTYGNSKESTRNVYLNWLRTFCRRLPQIRLRELTPESVAGALQKTPKSTSRVCGRFGNDLLGLLERLGGPAGEPQ